MDKTRRIYLDNIRWITVCIVVIYHVIYMYNGVQPFVVSLVDLFRFGQFIKFCFCLSTVLPQETIFCYGAWLA